TASILAALTPVAFAQQPATTQQPAKPAATQQPAKPPTAAQPAKPAAPAQPKAAATAPAATGDVQPTLLGQYGDWGAYTASPGGKKICFALAKPKTTKTEPEGRKRDQS